VILRPVKPRRGAGRHQRPAGAYIETNRYPGLAFGGALG